MEWDDEFGYEFLKFDSSNQQQIANWSPNKTILFLEPNWDTLDEYTNQWNKVRRRLVIKNQIESRLGTPFEHDKIKELQNTWLDLGARLYKALLPFAIKKQKYIKIIKDSNPNDKFDTWYNVQAYKPSFQAKVKPKTKSGK